MENNDYQGPVSISRVSLLVFAALIAASFAKAAPPPRFPILLDTDIGTDVDDAFALALVLRCPEIDLLGVTTVSGDTQARARLAAKMLWEAGRRDIPVAAGEAGKPLPIDQARWAEGFSSPQIRTEKAATFLKREIERRPGQLTLVPIGPLTNIATLLKSDPSIAKKIKRIVLMGGSIALGYGPRSKPAPEYNIASDAAAAQAVFSSGVPILMVPLDVTAMLQLNAIARHRVFSRLTPLTNALRSLYQLWGHETPTLFDPMAVAMVVEPSFCDTKELAIDIDAKGYTRVANRKPPNATVALHTDPSRFFIFYLSRVAQ